MKKFFMGSLLLISTFVQAKMTVALKPDKNPEAMLRERETLKAYLQKQTGEDIEVIVPLSNSVIQEGLRNGSIDVAYLGATDTLIARDQKNAEILLAVELKGQRTYRGYWLALKDKPYKNIADLKGKPVAFSSRTSTSGYVAPHAELVRRGLLKAKADPQEFFGKNNVWFGTGYVSAVEQVLQGRAEAAAVSYYVLDLDKHLNREQKAKLKKIDETSPIPTHVLAVSAQTPKANAEKIKRAFLNMNKEQSALRDVLFGDILVEISDPEAHLEPVKTDLELIGLR